MGLAQAEQKEVRAREEGGSRGSSAGGWRAAGRQAGGLAGWLGEGCIGLGWPGSLGQDYFGLLAGVEAAWQPPSLPLSPWASLSLHLTVFCNALSAIPAVWSSPAASAHPSCSEPPTIRLYEAPAPPASPFPCLSLGPCFCPVSSSLLSPPPPQCLCLSVCLPEGPVRPPTKTSSLGELTLQPPPRGQHHREWLLPGCPHCLT